MGHKKLSDKRAAHDVVIEKLKEVLKKANGPFSRSEDYWEGSAYALLSVLEKSAIPQSEIAHVIQDLESIKQCIKRRLSKRHTIVDQGILELLEESFQPKWEVYKMAKKTTNQSDCENCAKLAELKDKLAECEKAQKKAEGEIRDVHDQEARDQFAYLQH